MAMKQFKLIYHQSKCIGCSACQVACKDKNNLEPGLFFRRVETIEIREPKIEGSLGWVHYSGSCRHCKEPACMSACPSKAMEKSEDGAVVVNPKRCIGCKACVTACPYGAVTVSSRLKIARKCDSCMDLRREGKAPACADACPTGSLEYRAFETGQEETDFYQIQGIENLPHFLINPLDESAAEEENGVRVTRDGKGNRKTKEKQESHFGERKSEDQVYQAFSSFFTDWSQAYLLLSKLSDWNEHTPEEWKLEYDFLFSGTDADFNIPLWASASRGDGALLNKTTLEVILCYHKWGYAPKWIQGNPPDFIGEQLSFLAYLSTALKAENPLKARDIRTEDIKEAGERFITDYLTDTLEVIRKEAAKRCRFRGFLKLLDFLQNYVKNEEYGREIETGPGDMEVTPERKEEGRRILGMLNPPIPDQKPQVIPTAGLNNCGGICIIRPTVMEGCVLRIESDTGSQIPQIRACVRGRGYRKTFLNPQRLRYPMKRIGKRGEGKFQRISWEEAVFLIAKEWKRIRDLYGPGSRYVNYGWGVAGIMRPGALAERLLALDGGYLDSYNSYSAACINTVCPYIYGTNDCENSTSDLLNTKLLILWGDNPAETIFGPEKNYYLSKLKERKGEGKGVRVILIDPRMSQTGISFADQWIAPRPSTDSALADAMAYVIWSEGLQDQAFMDQYCLGFDEEHMPKGVPWGESYHTYVFGIKDNIPKTPEWASGITGVEPEIIRSLAREYGKTKPACILSGLGPQRHGNGEQTARGICMLACLTGNVGISGGGSGGAGGKKEHVKMSLFTNQVSNPYPGKIPVFLWTKALEQGISMTPKEDGIRGVSRLDCNIKMILNLAGNTLVNQHSDINHTIELLKDEEKCQFILCSDIFMTPSARFADVLLPATSMLEGNNITSPWRGSQYLLRNNQVVSPLFESRFEWEWLKEVAAELGLYEEFTEGKPDLEQWLEENYQILKKKEPGLPDYSVFCKQGGWQYPDPICYIAFENEIRDPKQHPFATPSGKIEIFSKDLYDLGIPKEIPGIPKYVPCPEGPEDPLRKKYPLQLIGWHTRRRCHSVHDNNEWQEEVEKPGVWIHPEDAKCRGIHHGEMTEIWNDRGRIRIPAVVTRRIRKGVVAISQGGWYTPDSEGTDVRGSINVLTSSSHPTPLAKGNPQHTNLVEIRPYSK